jgi:putative glutamine amidotransferase
MTQRPIGKSPRIGVAACFFHHDEKRAIFKGKRLLYSEESMLQWVMEEGGVPFTLPTSFGNLSPKDFLNEMDGLLLQGGSDVSPASYQEKPLRPEWQGDRVRDDYEKALIEEALKQNKPILGICRGLQILNVALGGSLYQDIELQVPTARNHRNWDIYDQNFHEIKIEPQTGMEKLYPDLKVATINTVHHQGVKELAPHLKVEARSIEDGIIEAFRLESDRYVFAVQWHPEFQKPHDKHLLPREPIMREFLEAVKQRKA